MSHEPFPTVGGRLSRSEVYAKLMHHLREASNLAYVMSHLHNTEDSAMDLMAAKSWLAMAQLLEKTEDQFRGLAQNNF